jgi:6-phosphogluconolactonase
MTRLKDNDMRFPPALNRLAISAFIFGITSMSAQIALASDGVVYVMTNKHDGNTVQVYKRGSAGKLRLIQEVATQGLGTGATRDPLTSQGAITLSEDGKLLFAVNPASAELTAFHVTSSGLNFENKISTLGLFPVSVTEHAGFVYVVNQLGIPNISGFTVSSSGQLKGIPSGTRKLPGGGTALPAEIKFSPDGALLLVTEKGNDQIDVFPFQADGRTGEPTVQASSGRVPFGFTFTPQGTLVVTEANGGLPGKGTVSTYSASGNVVSLISPSVPNSQTATCWVGVANQGQTAFVVNTVTGTISSYTIGPDGTLSLVAATAVNIGSAAAPIDLSITPDGIYLYVIESALGSIGVYQINGTTLTPVTTVTGLPLSIQGILAQ